MEFTDGAGNEWQSFDDVDVASESIPSVLSGSFGKQESADDFSLPDVTPATGFPAMKHTWNSNEEVAAILMSFDRHDSWTRRQLTTRPFSGSMFLYNRKDVKFRQDGYAWKTGKKGKLREDHMKLKIGGVSSIYGLYAHSALLSTFHRRCYWLLARPNLILVHYLNVIPKDDAIKLSLGSANCLSTASSSSDNNSSFAASSPPTSTLVISRDAILQQLCPMFGLPFPLQLNNPSSGDESPSAMQQRFEMLSRLVEMALPPSRQQLQVSESVPNQFCDSAYSTSSRSAATPTASSSSLSRLILPKSVENHQQMMDCSGGFQQPQNLQQQQMAMPPPPPPSSFYTSNNGNNVRSHKRPLDPNAGAFGDDMQSPASADVVSSTQPYVFWNPSQLAQVQQPQKATSTSAFTNSQQPQGQSYFLGAFEQQQEPLSPRRVSCSGGNSANMNNHNMLSLTYSAPSCVEVQQSSMSYSGGGDNSSNLFSSFASSGNEQEMLFPPFEFSSTEVEELLQFNTSNSPPAIPLPPTTRIANQDIASSPSSSSLSSMMIMDQQPHLQLQLHQGSNFGGTPFRSQISSNSQQEGLLQPQFATDQFTDVPTLIRIKDIAPQSSFVRGGIKVLIAGRWPAACRSITVSFGKTNVPATILQPGLLKCYCPAAPQPGAVDLIVCCDGVARSNPCTFYYRRQNPNVSMGNSDPNHSSPRFSASSSHPLSPLPSNNSGSQPSGNSGDAMVAKLQLLELLQQLKDTLKPATRLGLDVIQRACSQQVSLSNSSASTTELLAVVILTEITSDLPPPEFCTQAVQSVDPNNWTLLHFAAALGYGMLAEYLLDLRLQSRLPPVVEQQADVEACDANGLTPLHVACSRGQTSAAVTLFRRAPHLIAALNNDGLNPIGMAAAAGHYDVVRVMQAHEDSYLNQLESSLSFPEEPSLATSTSMVTFIGGNCAEQYADDSSQNDMVAASSAGNNSESKSGAVWPYDATSQHMFDLANHIIAALPERIKQVPSTAYLQPLPSTLATPLMASAASSSDAFVVYRERSASVSHGNNHQPTNNNSNNTPLGDSGLSTPLSFSFEAPEPNNSPQQQGGSSVRHRSPPPTPEQFNEYFNAPNFYLHHDFSHLTLSDDEQRKLFAAARVIQQAYRRYRESKLVTMSPSVASRQNSEVRQQVQAAQDQVLGILQMQSRLPPPPHQKQLSTGPEKLLQPSPINASKGTPANVAAGGTEVTVETVAPDEQRTVEIEQAALVIQAYYRRYKQFIAYRKMTEAATVIQSQFRSYSAQKRFRQSRDAARIIQTQYRMYRATNQRRGACAPYRSTNGAGSAGRRRSGSASSSSSLAGVQGTVNLAPSPGLCLPSAPGVRTPTSGPIFMQQHSNPGDMMTGTSLNDSFLNWNKSATSSIAGLMCPPTAQPPDSSSSSNNNLAQKQQQNNQPRERQLPQ